MAQAKIRAADIVSGQVYVPGGTDVAVADGGTGLGSCSEGDLLVGNGPNVLVTFPAPNSGERNGKTLGWVGNVLTWVTLGIVSAIRISNSTDTALTGGDIYADNAGGNSEAFINATVP